jgi:hypothetical protein
MPLTFNGTNITSVVFNGTNITTVIFNGTTVFTSSTYSWVWIDWNSSGFSADFYMSGGASTNEDMAAQIQATYPAASNQGKYVEYFSFATGYFNLFYSTT